MANAANAAARGREAVFGGAKPRIVTTPVGSMKLLLRPQDFGFRPLVSRSLGYEDEVFQLLSERLVQYDAVIEIGANVGVFTAAIGRRFRAEGKDVGRIVAFEPAEGAFARLRANLDLNGLGDVRAVKAAVSDSDGDAVFFEEGPLSTTNSLHYRFAAMSGRAVRESVVRTVDAARLGSFVPPGARLLVKIDAEGHEATILGRLGGLVRERRPDFIVEVLRRQAATMATVIEGWGYRCSRIRPHGLADEPLSSADHHCRDWLLSPMDLPHPRDGEDAL